MKTTITTVCLALVSWGAYAQDSHAAHQHSSQQHAELPTLPEFDSKELTSVYTRYIDLKNALVSSNYEEAGKSASSLSSALKTLKNGEKVAEIANSIAASRTIASQRQLFSGLSDELLVLVKDGKIRQGTVYVAYCPMANANTGGTWLSNEKQIRNPYFGDKMLKCGTIKEELNK